MNFGFYFKRNTISIIISLPSADKAPRFFHLSFNSTLQLIKGISSDLQKLLRYFNGAAIVVLFKIPFAL